MLKVDKKIQNKRIVVFNNDYTLRMGLTIKTGDEFVLGSGYNEFHLDEDDSLVLFVGEFTPHRIPPKNFRIEDEITVTTTEVHRKIVK